MTCETCRFWAQQMMTVTSIGDGGKLVEETIGVGVGECRRRSPRRAVGDLDLSNVTNRNWRWFPMTGYNDGCGQHSATMDVAAEAPL